MIYFLNKLKVVIFWCFLTFILWFVIAPWLFNHGSSSAFDNGIGCCLIGLFTAGMALGSLDSLKWKNK